MKISFQVKYNDESTGLVEFEKPAGAHPDSQMTVATAFLMADEQERTAVQVRRGDWAEWITRKTSANAILNILDKKS